MAGAAHTRYRYSRMAVFYAIGGVILVILVSYSMAYGIGFSLSGIVTGIAVGLALLLVWTARSHSLLKKGRPLRPPDYNSTGNLMIAVWLLVFAYMFLRIFAGESFAEFLALGLYFSFFPASLFVDCRLEHGALPS
jgi:hypothetical protein